MKNNDSEELKKDQSRTIVYVSGGPRDMDSYLNDKYIDVELYTSHKDAVDSCSALDKFKVYRLEITEV